MKSILQFLFFFILNLSFAQTPFSMAQGDVSEKNYLATIPYEEIKEKIIVEAIINDKTYRFIVDTGAPMVISEKLASELNLKTMRKIEIVDQSSLRDSVNIVLLPNIKIGGINFNNIPTLTSNESIITCFGTDGMIGSNLLKNSVIQFSSKEKLIRITDNPKKLNVKKKTRSELMLDGQSSPYIWIDQKNGKADAREQLLFDTGMDGFYDLSMNNYNKHFEKINLFNLVSKSTGSFSMGFHGSAEASEHYKFLLPELGINNVEFKNVTTTTTNNEISRIGATLLKYGIATVDYKNKKFYFDPFEEKKSFDLSEKQWPINAILNDGKLAVGIIWDSSLEEKIKLGDLILQVNDINYEQMAICDLIKSGISNIENEKIKITLKDATTGEIKQFEIEKM